MLRVALLALLAAPPAAEAKYPWQCDFDQTLICAQGSCKPVPLPHRAAAGGDLLMLCFDKEKAEDGEDCDTFEALSRAGERHREYVVADGSARLRIEAELSATLVMTDLKKTVVAFGQCALVQPVEGEPPSEAKI
jgi:hypothetical protein